MCNGAERVLLQHRVEIFSGFGMMTELLLIYTSLALFRMPFQDNYWLWKCIGFAGIGTFGTRFLVQWLYSEKHRESKIQAWTQSKTAS